jgi:predicted branched-subunit amino acid permease
MVKSGLTTAQALGMTFAAYAGSAQLAALPLIVAAAPLWIVTLTALVVNLRFTVYATALREHFCAYSKRRRLGLGYLIGDVTFVRFMEHQARHRDETQALPYYLGLAVCNWLWWQIGSVTGILAAAFIPASWGLELAGVLALIALLVPFARQIPALVGIVAAAALAVWAHEWPLRLGVLLGIIGGIVAAMLVARWQAWRGPQRR